MKRRSWLLSCWVVFGFTLIDGAFFLGRAQTVPVIDAATLEIRSGRLSFQFRAIQGDPRDFVVLRTGAIVTGGGWTPVAEAIVEALGPDLYEASLAMEAPGPAFLRIQRSGPPALGPAPVINEIMSENAAAYASPDGGFWDWIELYNPHDEALDLAGFALTDDVSQPGRWRFPTFLLQPGAYIVVYASDLNRVVPGAPFHTNFQLQGGGETVFLFDPFDRELDRIELPPLAPDQSIGRAPDGGDTWHLYAREQISPGRENPVDASPPLVEPPEFSVEGGFHEGPVRLEFRPRRPGDRVRFTLDGSAATQSSPLAEGPVDLSRTMVVRAVGIDAEGRVSVETVRTYFIGVHHDLPVVSLAAPSNHFQFRDGYLYGMGSSVINSRGEVLQSYPYSGSNAWRDREVEVQLEFFEPDGRVGLRQKAGIKIFGGWGSRGYPQKSFAVFARGKYGAGRMNHRMFPGLPIDSFESLVLRNSGNDNQSTHQTPPRPPITEFGPTLDYGSYFVNGTFTLMRDALMQSLLDETDLDTQGYRPAVLYINGDYWGIYNLREKMNEHYVAAHHDLAAGDVDVIEGYGDVRSGDGQAYTAMRDFLNARNLATGTNYQRVVDTWLEVDNFIDYNLAVIYFQNFDIGNIKCWRPRTPAGRFRWMVFDQDYGFGLWPDQVYVPAMARDYADYDNMFRFATANTGTSTGWPNAGGRTLLLRRMLAHPGFRERFIRRCADLLNTSFREERVLSRIDTMAAVIRPEMASHLQRWSWAELQKRGFGAPHVPDDPPLSLALWESNVGVLRDFARNRPAALRADCIEHFQLTGGLGTLEVRCDPPEAGQVCVNSVVVSGTPWRGVYFGDYPSVLFPVPRGGHRFTGWTTPTGQTPEPRLSWRVGGGATHTIIARFEPTPPDTRPQTEIRITEINYHGPDDLDADDWVEIHNPGNLPVELGGWVLRDQADDPAFVFPEMALGPGEYRVLARNIPKFQVAHPGERDCLGPFPFGLGNEGDSVRLFDSRGILVEQVTYDDRAPWPVAADGGGSTLQRVRTDLDPNVPEAWAPSPTRGGTPNRS